MAKARWVPIVVTAGEEEDRGPRVRSSHVLSSVDGRDGEVWLVGGEVQARIPAGMTCYKLTVSGKPAPGASSLEGAWESHSPQASEVAPPPRNAHAQAAIGQDLYIFGGRNEIEEGEGVLQDLWAFNTETKQWREIQCGGDGDGIPESRSYATACSCDGRFYLFGGCGANGRLADLWCFDPAKGSWRRLPDPPSLAGRGGPTLEGFSSSGGEGEAREAQLLVFAGFAGKETKDLLTFSLAREAWTVHSAPDALVPRSVCQSFVAGGEGGRQIICYGGEVEPSSLGHAGAGSFSSEVVAIDEAARVTTVETRTSKSDDKRGPEPRGWGSAARLFPNCGLIYGGLTGSDEDPQRLGDAWALVID